MSGDPNVIGSVPLVDAVKQFNDWAKTKQIGKTQPPLTADEIVAAIRGWDHERSAIPLDLYKVFQEIAETKKVPRAWHLTAFEHWKFNNFDFDVWRIEMTIATKPGSSYTLRIRDQRIRSKPINQSGSPDTSNVATYPLKYTDANNVVSMLGSAGKAKTADEKISFDARTNSVIIYASPERQKALMKAIQALDELNK